MNKQEFLAQLKKKLIGIPLDDIVERIGFYDEMIDDRVEEGLTEEQAISELGELDNIVQQIVSEIPMSKLVKEKVKPSRALRAWEIVFLVLGSPIWLSLLIVLFAIIISIYAVIWSVMIALWAIEVSLAACLVGGVGVSILFMTQGHTVSGVAMLGVGLMSAGLSVFGFYGCKCATKAILKLTKKIILWIKSCFIKKEGSK